jgi:hypothetical protein
VTRFGFWVFGSDSPRELLEDQMRERGMPVPEDDEQARELAAAYRRTPDGSCPAP